MTTPPNRLEAPKIPHDFGFTEEHEAARNEARRFLEERCPITEVRRLAEDRAGFDPALFRDLARLGWLGLTAAESMGGLGLDSLHQALLLDEMGRVLLPSPYLGSLFALSAIEHAGNGPQQAALGPAIVNGDQVATMALSEPGGTWEPDDVRTTASQEDGVYVLRGVKTHVMFGNAATLVVVPCKEPSGDIALFAVELPLTGLTVEAETSLDGTRRMARLTFDGARVPKSARLERDGLAALVAVHLRGFVLLAAEMCGGIERVLGLTRDYATTRIQFDRPIGAFQAVKHPIVDMMIACEHARSLALGAAVALDVDGASAVVLGRSAKAFASDAFVSAAKKGVQLHGGFGFTWDCDVHFYFKRALWSRGMLGDGIFHRRHIARRLLGD
ncbi:MAG TPA: acyl-CoA dehydrogenase family protein [Polyangiaceae bacterium]